MNDNIMGDTMNVSGAANRHKGTDTLFEEGKQQRREVVEEVSIDLDDIKNEISEAVRSVIGSQAVSDKPAADVRKELEAVKVRLQAIQVSTEELVRDNGSNITALHRSVADIRDRVGEAIQAINTYSKVSDGMFDLKNAQVNMKKSIDNAGQSIRILKKRFNMATVIFSVLALLIIVLQIIALLS